MRRLHACSIAVLLLWHASPLPSQTAPAEARVAGAYSSFSIFSEIPTNFLQPPEVMLGLGRMQALGSDGRWLMRLDLIGGLVAGRYFLDGVFAGPQVTAALALPGDYLQFSTHTFGEVYPLVGGAVYQYARWRAERTQSMPEGLSVVPSLLAGAGIRVYDRSDPRATILTIDFAYDARLRYSEPRLLIRVSSHRPLRRAE